MRVTSLLPDIRSLRRLAVLLIFQAERTHDSIGVEVFE
jgi:hypothetical protein